MKKTTLLALTTLVIIALSTIYLISIKREKAIEKETWEVEKTKEIEMAKLNLTSTNVTLIIVYDNYEYDPKLSTGFGFGCIVKTKDKTILFDTGSDSLTLLSNMEKLEINPKTVDIIVLSHIHGDHVGGLLGFLEKNSNVKVYIPESFPDSFRNSIEQAGAQFIDISSPTLITKSVGTTGELGTWIKEQSLIVNSTKGLIVITGCAHPGIVDIVKKAKELTNESIYLMLGGFHHPPLSVVDEFRKLGVEKVAPCHCTGDAAINAFAQEYGNDYIKSGVGKIIEI